MPSGTRPLPFLYSLWFLYLEPFSALSAAYLTYFRPATYLHMTNFPSSTSTALPPSTTHLSTHLAGLYLFFGLVGALVLRSTNDRKVWKALSWCMLGSDLVYVVGLWQVGGRDGEWVKAWTWDAVGWGNYGTTWWAFGMRVCFLMGVGLDR